MSSAESYEALPYPSAAFSQTHPSRLAATARLHGVIAPAPEHCRVLELGCSDGGNLINIAYTLPGAECVGIDYAPGHIVQAKRNAEALNLNNCAFYAADIAAMPPNLGLFDYIIAHGVFSWVPAAVQDAMFAVLRDMLSPNGVGYISYNTFPGWHGYRMMREVLGLGIESGGDVRKRVSDGRLFLESLQRASGGDNPAYTAVVASTADSFLRSADTYLGHEYFEDNNEPMYVQQFVEKAREFGLEYVAESFSPGTYLHNAPERVINEIEKLSDDRIEREQWLDFFIGRQFRKTLLCKSGYNSPTELTNENFARVFIGSSLVRVPDSPDDAPQFVAPNGLAIGSANPVLKSALTLLSENRPHPFELHQLLGFASGDAPSDAAQNTVLALCRQFYDDNLAQFYASSMPCASVPGERPKVSRVAQLQAQTGNVVTTLHHTSVQFDEPIPLLILRYANGERTRDELFHILQNAAEENDFGLMNQEGKPLHSGEERDEILHHALDVCLGQLAKYALLEG